jgi:hypothetical protein
MLHDRRVIVAQREVPEGTNEITKVKATLQEISRDRDRVLAVLPL